MFSTRTHTESTGFTLAELLVAIVIIGIMLAVALPTLTGIASESRIDGAAHAIHSAVKMARQHAVTQKQPTYMLFHDFSTSSDVNLAGRSYAVFTIDTRQRPLDQSAGSFLLEWQTLPAGVVFDNQTSEGRNNVFVHGNNSWRAGFDGDNRLRVKGTVYPVLAFNATGTQRMDYKNDIFLAEGLFDEEGNLKRTTDQGKRIRIDSAGRSRVSDIHYDESGKATVLAR